MNISLFGSVRTKREPVISSLHDRVLLHLATVVFQPINLVGQDAMANSKSRRRTRRELQEAGLEHLLALSSHSPLFSKPAQSRFWLKFPVWAWTCIGLLTAVITLLEGYSWLELQKDESLSPKNPFKTMFIIVNQGYAPITNIEVDCVSDFNTDRGGRFSNIHLRNRMPKSLWHENKVTLPCLTIVGYSDEPVIPNTIFGFSPAPHIESADMTISISYRLFGVFQRSQAFHLVAFKAADNSYRWGFWS